MRLPPRSVLSVLLLLATAPGQGREPVRARQAMVVAQEPLAAGAGVEVLRRGGNVIDAAVAVGFALAVTHPSAGNLGGGGFLLARFEGGEKLFLDFRERAPGRASRDMYLDEDGELTRDSVTGWRAPGVPGTVAGLERAHRERGRLPWTQVLAPAIRLAEEGFPVSWALARSLRGATRLAEFPESKRIFLNGGRHFQPGDRLAQPELAATLRRIAEHGARDFYHGETARLLAAAMEANGGLITRQDLADYAAVERQPLRGRYKEYEIITPPPPSSGGVGLLQMLGMLEGSGYDRHGAGSAAAIHYVAEVMRRFYADRSRYLADPDYFTVPVRGLLDGNYIAARRASIEPDRASDSDAIGPGEPAAAESAETTHYTVADAKGNVVAVTYTLNGSYGSGVTVPGLGFLLNNEMDDFSAKPGSPNMFGLVQGEANRIEPGKRPLSSMTPAIVEKSGGFYLTLGAPGGATIINGVLQVLLNVLDHRMGIQDAVDRPRFHHQWKPDRISLEDGFSPDTVALLERRGHETAPIRSVAVVEAILFDGEWLQGASDGRGSGKAAGY